MSAWFLDSELSTCCISVCYTDIKLLCYSDISSHYDYNWSNKARQEIKYISFVDMHFYGNQNYMHLIIEWKLTDT